MADAHGSGPCVRKDVRVQLPPRPPCSGPIRWRGSGLSRCPHHTRGGDPPDPHGACSFRLCALGRLVLTSHDACFLRSSGLSGPVVEAFLVRVGAVGGGTVRVWRTCSMGPLKLSSWGATSGRSTSTVRGGWRRCARSRPCRSTTPTTSGRSGSWTPGSPTASGPRSRSCAGHPDRGGPRWSTTGCSSTGRTTPTAGSSSGSPVGPTAPTVSVPPCANCCSPPATPPRRSPKASTGARTGGGPGARTNGSRWSSTTR